MYFTIIIVFLWHVFFERWTLDWGGDGWVGGSVGGKHHLTITPSFMFHAHDLAGEVQRREALAGDWKLRGDGELRELLAELLTWILRAVLFRRLPQGPFRNPNLIKSIRPVQQGFFQEPKPEEDRFRPSETRRTVDDRWNQRGTVHACFPRASCAFLTRRVRCKCGCCWC